MRIAHLSDPRALRRAHGHGVRFCPRILRKRASLLRNSALRFRSATIRTSRDGSTISFVPWRRAWRRTNLPPAKSASSKRWNSNSRPKGSRRDHLPQASRSSAAGRESLGDPTRRRNRPLSRASRPFKGRILKVQLRVDLTRSPHRLALTGIAHSGRRESTFSGHSGSRLWTSQLGGKRASRALLGRTGVRAIAGVPLRARNWPHRPNPCREARPPFAE